MSIIFGNSFILIDNFNSTIYINISEERYIYLFIVKKGIFIDDES